jgi:flagellar M-ring protein FliF
MKQLEQLAQAAVGFDTLRGDQVVMTNVSFSSNVPEVKLAGAEKVMDEAKTFVQTQPGLLRTGMMGLVAVLAVMFVLRPVATQLTATLKAPVLLAAGTPTGSARAPGTAGSAGALGDSSQGGEGGGMSSLQQQEEQIAAPKRRQMKQGQVMFEHVADSIVREPVQSTRLLETWIGPQEGD